MDDTFENEADTDNDDDEREEIPRVPRASAKNGAGKNGAGKTGAGGGGGSGGKKGGAVSAKETERKKRELITMGKAKGFLTYDEVNEHMPENIISSDQMDDWLSAFSGEGIEILAPSSKRKVAGKGGEAEAEAEAEDEEEAAETA